MDGRDDYDQRASDIVRRYVCATPKSLARDIAESMRAHETTLTRERDEALTALRGLYESLGTCDFFDGRSKRCYRRPTRVVIGESEDDVYCDEHAPAGAREMPGADAMREAERVIGMRGKEGE